MLQYYGLRGVIYYLYTTFKLLDTQIMEQLSSHDLFK